MQDVRVRFAPSPTGLLHVGGVRTALFNYLFAKHHHGTVILRLEDTDRERFVEDSVEQIQQGLAWLGLKPDEGYWLGEHKGSVGPYVQSQRLPEYQRYAKQLVELGLAYYSRITPVDFQAKKEAAEHQKQPFVYRSKFEPPDDHKTDGYPIRLRVKAGTTRWRDELRGEFTTNNDLIDEFVILKADGYPTYNFANVVDDHLMRISHVIRGDEFLSSTAKHALLYDYFGWSRPIFIHLPVILGPDGRRKLSKRDGDVDILSYQSQGYLPAAMINFLALLGWNDGTEQELFTLAELIERFNINRLQTSPAVFDIDRLRWMNGEYIRKLSTEELVQALEPYVPASWLSDRDYFSRVVALDQERLKMLSEAQSLMSFFFEPIKVTPQQLTNQVSAQVVKGWLTEVEASLQKIEFTEKLLEENLRTLVTKLGIKPGQLFSVVRVAISGTTTSPGLFATLAVLGKDQVLNRLQASIRTLQK